MLGSVAEAAWVGQKLDLLPYLPNTATTAERLRSCQLGSRYRTSKGSFPVAEPDSEVLPCVPLSVLRRRIENAAARTQDRPQPTIPPTAPRPSAPNAATNAAAHNTTPSNPKDPGPPSHPDAWGGH